jgi:CBS domain-containing protein
MITMMVSDFMIQNPIILEENQDIKTLLKTMVDNKIGGVPVVNQNKELVGIITDGDVLRHLNPKGTTVYGFFIYAYHIDAEELDTSLEYKTNVQLKSIMKKKVQTLNEEDSLEQALETLSKHHFKKLPVINKNKQVVGVISRGDIIRKLTEKIFPEL